MRTRHSIRTYISLLLITSFIFSSTQVIEASIADTKEIVILWDKSVPEISKYTRLSAQVPSLFIAESFDNYTLCTYKEFSSTTLPHLLEKLNKTEGVLVAEPNYEIELYGITDDPYSDAQWPLNNSGSYTHIVGSSSGITESTLGVDLNIKDAWMAYNRDLGNTREVTVAIIDTGVDINHPDLSSSTFINFGEIPNDGIDNDNNGFIDDINGWDFYNDDNTVCSYEYNKRLGLNVSSPYDDDDHGTHIAGIIAATANNHIGIAGVASNVNVKILPLKIHGGETGKGTVSNAIKAIKYATAMGADICNMSWGSTTYSEALETAIKESSMLFVTAAGNDGSNNDAKPMYPASLSLDNLISVTFIDANGNLTFDSNYGRSNVDIAAPGSDIFSTLVGSYGTMSGSSMATPHVTGIAAMLYAYSDHLFASNIKEILLSTRKEIPSLTGYIRYPGIPDAFAAVSALDSLRIDSRTPTLSIDTSFDKETIKLSFSPTDAGASKLRVMKYLVGTREITDFLHGTVGISIIDNSLSLAKSGDYTFYLSDYAGNETILPYYVEDDTTPPTIDASYKVSNNYKILAITAKVNDAQSGIKTVKYLEGVKTANDFKSGSAGTPLNLTKDQGIIKFYKPSIYTIYATDYRGNKSIQVINAKIVPSRGFSLNRTAKVLGTGKHFRLWPTLTPSNSTDKVLYRSSNPKIVTVNPWGLLTGISEGRATITATTSSGIKRTCIVTVKTPILP